MATKNRWRSLHFCVAFKVRLKEVTLVGSDAIEVATDSYQNMGILGPGDSIDLSFNILVYDNADDGTEHLKLAIVGSSHTFNANWDVPIRVESAGIKIIPSRPLKLTVAGGTIEFDVANTHSSTFTAVSIEPQAEGITFTPTEYFIGTMEPDELFTIEFDCEVTGNVSGRSDLRLLVVYQNGNNQHEVVLNNRVIEIEPVMQERNSNTAMIGAVLLLLIVAGVYIYRKKRRRA